MSELEDITYSRADTIAAISDFYQFLVGMYMKDSQVIYPPEEGWPSIINADPDLLKSLGKSDEVLSLLAHLPYIRSPGNWNDDAEPAPGCRFAEWQDLIAKLCSPTRSTTGDQIRIMTEGAAFAEIAPAHVFSLTCGDRENPVMVLDTKLGIIHWEDCPHKIERGYYQESVEYGSDEDVPEEEADWRHGAMAWAIPDFFEIFKDEFRKLNWIPISHHTVWNASDPEGPGEAGMVPMLREIYRQHHWPDLALYRKSECLEAVQKAMKEKYPDFACVRG